MSLNARLKKSSRFQSDAIGPQTSRAPPVSKKLLHKCIQQHSTTNTIHECPLADANIARRCMHTKTRVRQWRLLDWSIWLTRMHASTLPCFNDFMNCCNNKNQPTTICATHTRSAAPAMVKSTTTDLRFTCDRAAPSHTPQELLPRV